MADKKNQGTTETTVEKEYTANDISKMLLTTIETVVDKKLSTAQYDKTVKGTIKKIKDSEKHEYEVELFTGGVVTAKDNSEWQLYPVGSTVLINCPSNSSTEERMIVRQTSLTENNFTATFQDHRPAKDSAEENDDVIMGNHAYGYITEDYGTAELQYVLLFMNEEEARQYYDPNNTGIELPDYYDNCVALILPDGSRIDLQGFDF